MRVQSIGQNYQQNYKNQNNPTFKSTFYIIGKNNVRLGNYSIQNIAENIERFLNSYNKSHPISVIKKGFSLKREIVVIQLKNGSMTRRAIKLAKQLTRDYKLKGMDEAQIKFGTSLCDLD